ncbi:hypothetical protein [Parvibaculum sp.]|uniref:hypothetical protein n=1 Tax=Parvibaculum sp. TaxID=2024848 RepID=UPI003C744253
MTHSQCWRVKAMTFVERSQIVANLADKRRCLKLATKCMRYSVRLDRPAASPVQPSAPKAA